MWRERLYTRFVEYWLPLALVLFLTGMFWVGDRAGYHKLYYVLLALPTLLVALACAPKFLGTAREPLFIVFAVFSAYVMSSLAWSPGAVDYSKLKYPLYIGMLLLAVAALGEVNMRRLVQVVALAGVGAVLAALITMAVYFLGGMHTPRLNGLGALYNPLLTSHVYGFFSTLWLAALMASPKQWQGKLAMFAVLVLLLFLTGSRTPFTALAASVAWMVIMVADRRIVWLALAMGIIASLGVWLFGSELLARGLSYRPLIWAETWRQIMPALWFGHGYDAGIDVVIDGLNQVLADPHNLTLSVIYHTGLVGVVMWLSMYGYSLACAWRMRGSGLVLISSTLLVYGFAAGMTEGGAFMSRPKEHWFLIWIPIALHLAVLRRASLMSQAQKSVAQEGV